MDATESKKRALQDALAHIEKQFGQGSIMKLGEQGHRSHKTISTGALPLDHALGIGGVARGRVVEIYGHESSGKSTLAMHIVASAQKSGGIAAYIDAEHALDPKYASRIGVNVNELLLSQPSSGEEALNIAETLARSNAVDVIVIDSVAALVPKSELEGEVGDSFMGLQARMMSQALRKITSVLAKGNTCAIFINQVREKIGVFFGNPEVTTGGRALKFYASQRIEIRRTSSIKGPEGTDIGIRVKARVVKNKLAPPFTLAEFDIIFNQGISHIGTLVEFGSEIGILTKKGAWFSFGEQRLGHGKENVIQELQKNPELAVTIERKIREKCQLLQDGTTPLAQNAPTEGVAHTAELDA